MVIPEERMDDIATDAALLMAVIDSLIPSLNGPSTQLFTEALEAHLLGLPSDYEPTLTAAIQRASEGGRPRAWVDRLQDLADRGIHLLTVFDDAYPSNLRMVPDHPPILFTRGALLPA